VRRLNGNRRPVGVLLSSGASSGGSGNRAYWLGGPVYFPDSSKIPAPLRFRGEVVEMEDDRLSGGTVAVGLVPDLLLLSDEEAGSVVIMFSASPFVRNWAADMEGRSRRGVTDPPSRDNEATLSPSTESAPLE